jgi:hypothetical protein
MTLTLDAPGPRKQRGSSATNPNGEWPRPPRACPADTCRRPCDPSREWAYDFLRLAQRNPKPCPFLDVTEHGDPGEAERAGRI